MIKIELQKNHQWMLNFNREKDTYTSQVAHHRLLIGFTEEGK